MPISPALVLELKVNKVRYTLLIRGRGSGWALTKSKPLQPLRMKHKAVLGRVTLARGLIGHPPPIDGMNVFW